MKHTQSEYGRFILTPKSHRQDLIVEWVSNCIRRVTRPAVADGGLLDFGVLVVEDSVAGGVAGSGGERTSSSPDPAEIKPGGNYCKDRGEQWGLEGVAEQPDWVVDGGLTAMQEARDRPFIISRLN